MLEPYLIWEPSPDGHRLVYCRELLYRCSELGATITVGTTQDALDDKQFGLHLGPLGPQTRTFTSTIEAARSAVAHGETLVVLSGDDKVFELTHLPRGLRARVLIMSRPEWTLKRRPLRSLVKFLAVRSLAVRSRTDILYLCPSAWLSDVGLSDAPDPVFLSLSTSDKDCRLPALRAQYRMSPGCTWLGVVGGISGHKNPSLVIRTAALLAESGLSVGIALFGPIAPRIVSSVLAELDSAERSGVCISLHNRRFTNEELGAAIASLDVLVCAYDTDAPNSTSAKAYHLGTKVVGAGSPTFLTNGQKFWTSTTVELTVEGVGNAVREAISAPSRVAQTPPPPTEFADRMLGIA